MKNYERKHLQYKILNEIYIQHDAYHNNTSHTYFLSIDELREKLPEYSLHDIQEAANQLANDEYALRGDQNAYTNTEFRISLVKGIKAVKSGSFRNDLEELQKTEERLLRSDLKLLDDAKISSWLAKTRWWPLRISAVSAALALGSLIITIVKSSEESPIENNQSQKVEVTTMQDTISSLNQTKTVDSTHTSKNASSIKK